ncbi:MAG: hypothetical protein FWD76_04875 [Firmicutes bacterium]|nr:hypothetical protein [Bacillota bacterium]
MQCKFCGAELKGNWCPKCGKTANAGGLGKQAPMKPGQAPQRVIPPRESNTVQDRSNSHLTGFGDRAKQELRHQQAVKKSGPDWGGKERTAKRSRKLELLFTGLLLISALVLLFAFMQPFINAVGIFTPAQLDDINTGKFGSSYIDQYPLGEYRYPKVYNGFSVFGLSGAVGIFGTLAFVLIVILLVATILRFLVVAGKLQALKFLDGPVGSIILTGAGLGVAVLSFLLFSTVASLVTKGAGGEPIGWLIQDGSKKAGAITANPDGGSGSGLGLLMPFGFVALGVGIGIVIVRLITLTPDKKAVKPTAESVKQLKEQGSNFGFDRKANTFNRPRETYQPAPIRTMADTVGAPPPVYEEQAPMMDYPVDEFGNPIMPTEEELMAQNGQMMPEMPMQQPVMQQPPMQPMQPPVAPVAPAPAPAPAPEPVVEAAPAATEPAKLSPAEAARARLAEAKAKLEAAKKQ